MRPSRYGLLAKCPHCGKEKGLLDLMSGNTFGATSWSDTKLEAPMLPKLSPVQKCPHCGRYYLLSRARKTTGNKPTFETGWLSFDETLEAHTDLVALSSAEATTVAIITLWAFNDIYRKGGEPTEEQKVAFKTYIKPLIDDGSLFEEKLLTAEVYRELGCFEECLNILRDYNASNDYTAFIAKEIKWRAEEKDPIVFIIDDEKLHEH